MEKKENNPNSLFYYGNLKKWICPKGYYIHYFKSFDMIFHSHSRLELMYIAMGELHFLYKDQQNQIQSLVLRPNEYIFIDADVPHKIYIDDINTQIYNIEFSLDSPTDSETTLQSLYYAEESVKIFLSSSQRIFKLRDSGVFLQNLVLIQNYIGNKINTQSDRCLNFMLSSFFMLIANNYSEHNKHVCGIGYVNKAVNYIYDNFNQDFTLDDLAKICNISPNYLNKLFKENFNLTAMAFLNKYKIEKATFLLTNTDLSVSDICEQTGYRNKMNFNQNFKKFIGLSPKKYRSENHTTNRVKSNELDKQNSYLVD